MKQTLARIIKPYTQGCLLRPNPHLLSSSICLSSLKLRLFTSKSHGVVEHRQQSSVEHQKEDPIDDGDADISNTELKKSVERFMKGDEEAIPSIFQAILERKLAGNGDESNDDDELMKELRDILPPVDDDGVSREKEFDFSDED